MYYNSRGDPEDVQPWEWVEADEKLRPVGRGGSAVGFIVFILVAVFLVFLGILCPEELSSLMSSFGK